MQNNLFLGVDSAYSNYQWYLNGVPINNTNNQFINPTQSGLYTVEAFNIYGCASMSNTFSYNMSNITNLESNISIYPNPFHEKTNININNIKIDLINIKSIEGKLIKSINVSNNIIQLYRENLKSGVYVIEFINQEKEIARKLVYII